MPGSIIALTGPSGVGKNHTKQKIKEMWPDLVELEVLTTRPARPGEGPDRKAGIDTEEFLSRVKTGEIFAAHQPFGVGTRWYGFSKKQIQDDLSKNKTTLTEVHVDNVEIFKKEYGQKVFVIGLVADREYLEHNLNTRKTEQSEEKNNRLTAAQKECKKIAALKADGLVDVLFEINWENRENFSESLIGSIREYLNERKVMEHEKIDLR